MNLYRKKWSLLLADEEVESAEDMGRQTQLEGTVACTELCMC